MSETESQIPQLLPFDEFNQTLETNVHPPKWTNPSPSQPYQLVVVGAGTAGLVTAAGAAGLGTRVALIERELMGGDCLNVGCVPSKAIISSARRAATIQDWAKSNQIELNDCSSEFANVMKRMRRLRAQISPMDSAQRFSDLGVDVFLGNASFSGQDTITIGRRDGSEEKIQFKKAVIATGARASAPPIDGLDSVAYLTNETLFSLTELPETFGIIGGGPIGAEMAQAFARLGSRVTLFERANHILSREDSKAAEIVQTQLVSDGVEILTGVANMQVHGTGGSETCIKGNHSGGDFERQFDKLLVAVGRAPNVEGLNLESVNVNHDQTGVSVNEFLQTSNPKIYAAGDICSRFKFTHAADFQARIVIQNALFALGPFGRKKAGDLIIPWATYTSPELAHVGINEADANNQGVAYDTYIQELAHVDRAILEGNNDGFVKVLTEKGSDKILGATIVAENAGDLISQITLAMNAGLGLSKIGATIHPYPTQADAIRKLGDQFNKTKLTDTSKKLLDLLRRINVGQ